MPVFVILPVSAALEAGPSQWSGRAVATSGFGGSVLDSKHIPVWAPGPPPEVLGVDARGV